jgi:hypothetical protein
LTTKTYFCHNERQRFVDFLPFKIKIKSLHNLTLAGCLGLGFIKKPPFGAMRIVKVIDKILCAWLNNIFQANGVVAIGGLHLFY